MAKAVGITLLSLLNIGAFALPAPQDNPSDPTAAKKFQWQFYKSCPQESKDAILKAWDDSKRFADALKSWKPKADFQPAMEMYMGDRCTYEDLMGFNFPKQIQDTSRRERGLYDGVSEYGNAYLWVYCNEDSRWWAGCKEDETGAVLAYEEEDVFFNNWYITFCPAFYKPKWNRPLDTVIKDIKDRNLDPMVIENWYGVQGATFFHETMHMSQLVTSPQATDGNKDYGPEKVYELARNRNTDAAVYNADSWTMTAQAIFAQQEMSLKDPPYPHKYAPDGVTVGNLGDIPDHYLETVMEKVPTDFFPQGAGDNPTKPYKVDPNFWSVYGADEPPQDPPKPKSLSILGEYVKDSPNFTWLFFWVDDGSKAECRTDTAAPPKEVPFSSSGTTYPEGPWDLEIDGQKCQYTSNNDPGKLVCGDKTIACVNDPADTDPGNPDASKGEYNCGDKIRQPVFVCGPI